MKLFKTAITCMIALVSTVNVYARGTWTTFTNSDYISDMAIRSDTLWCATTGGVVRWNIRDMTYKKFITSDGLSNNYVTSIAIDSHGIVWAGTDGGVIAHSKEAFAIFFRVALARS